MHSVTEVVSTALPVPTTGVDLTELADELEAAAVQAQLARAEGVPWDRAVDDPRFDALAAHFPDTPAVRSIIRVDVDRVSDSCGFGVPLMEFKGDRRALNGWAADKTEADVIAYQQQKNLTSIDGLAGVPAR